MKRGMMKAERLREMERLYIQRAFSDIDMAERLGVDRSTVYRDRIELEAEYPFIQDELARWKIDRSQYLSEIKLNLHEALALYLAARRVSRQTRIQQTHTAAALEKLSAALQQPMTEKLVRAAQKVLDQQSQPDRVKVLEVLAQAWVDSLKVRITYRSASSDKARDTVLAPYLIEPSLWSEGIYVIGYSDYHREVRTFKVERIEAIRLLTESCEVPEDFDEDEVLKHAWGIWGSEGEPVEVTLKFAPGPASRRLRESIWLPGEEVTEAPDGGCIWTAQVAQWREMLSWIRGWGAEVEVLEPEELRQEVAEELRRAAAVYSNDSVLDNGLLDNGYRTNESG
jgi:predicted DNA-binding transcriptional regulator YafY